MANKTQATQENKIEKSNVKAVSKENVRVISDHDRTMSSVEDILEQRAQEWWSKKTIQSKQMLSSLYNFRGKHTIKEMYIENQVAEYNKLARVSAIALQIAQSSKELGMTPEELMSPNGLLLMEAEKQYSKL